MIKGGILRRLGAGDQQKEMEESFEEEMNPRRTK